MSIPVDIGELTKVLADYPWGYFTTVGADQRAHSLAVPTVYRDGLLHIDAGKSSRRNLEVCAEVSMVFPHPQPGGYSLIIDGPATVSDGEVSMRPMHAILHRPALGR